MWILPERTTTTDIDAIKRCRAGSSRREIVNEEPAPAEPSRPPRTRRPEPIGEVDESNDRFASGRPAVSSARSERALSPATLVRSVRTETSNRAMQIIVDTDGAVQSKDFILTGPTRIVVDLAGVRSTASGLVDRVRVGEPGTGSVRIVIDLQSMTRYRVVRDGSLLIIIIGEEGSAAGSSGSR